jgi:hypothetical protein
MSESEHWFSEIKAGTGFYDEGEMIEFHARAVDHFDTDEIEVSQRVTFDGDHRPLFHISARRLPVLVLPDA